MRPTGDRVREALFSILGDIEGARVLDLFAGTGALSMEALSRGAAFATLVERDRRSLAAIGANVESLQVGDEVHVVRRDVRTALADLEGPFDLIFADPPYAQAEALLGVVTEALPRLLAPGGVAVFEHAKSFDPGEAPRDMERARSRSYGDTTLSFYERPESPK